MKNLTSLLKIISFINILIFCLMQTSCKKDSTSIPVKNWPSDTLVFKTELQTNARTITRSEIVSGLDTAKSDFSKGIFYFANASASIKALVVGQTVAFENLDILKITAKTSIGNDVKITAQQGLITDYIKNGEIIYRGAVRMNGKKSFKENSPVVPLPTTITFGGTESNMELQYTISENGGKTTIDGTSKFISDGIKISIGYHGWVNEFFCEYTCNIENGKITYRRYVLRDVEAQMDVTFGGIETSCEKKFELPAIARIPMPIGYLPTWIGIGGGIEISSTLLKNCTSTGKTTFEMKGSMGFEEMQNSMKLLGDDFSVTSSYKENDMVAVNQSGFGVVVEFPKLSIGVGESCLKANVYASMKNEMVLNITPHYEAAGGFPVITGNCYVGNLNTGYYVGATAEAFSLLQLKAEQQVYAKTSEVFKTGKYCD